MPLNTSEKSSENKLAFCHKISRDLARYMVSMSMKVSRYDALHLAREQVMQPVQHNLEEFLRAKIHKAYPQDQLGISHNNPSSQEEEERKGGKWELDAGDFWFMLLNQAELAGISLTYKERGKLLFGLVCYPQEKSFLEVVKGGQVRLDQRNIRINSQAAEFPVIRTNTLVLPEGLRKISALWQVSGSLSKDFYDFFMLRIGAIILELDRLPEYWAEAVKASGGIYSKARIDKRNFFFISSVGQAKVFSQATSSEAVAQLEN